MKSYEIGIEDPERDDRTDAERAHLLLRYLYPDLYPELGSNEPKDDDIGS